MNGSVYLEEEEKKKREKKTCSRVQKQELCQIFCLFLPRLTAS